MDSVVDAIGFTARFHVTVQTRAGLPSAALWARLAEILGPVPTGLNSSQRHDLLTLLNVLMDGAGHTQAAEDIRNLDEIHDDVQ